MRTVVVAALDAALPYEIREAVRDWTAAGLVQSTTWIDVAEVTERAVELDAVTFEPGRPEHRSGLRGLLGADESLAAVRLISLQIVGDPAAQVGVDTVQVVQELVADSGVAVRRVNLLVRVDPGEEPVDAPVMLSTPNVVLQPADSASPGAPAVPLDRRSLAFVAHCAGGLATVAGVWAGQRTSPYDDEQSWAGGGTAEMVRWYRRVVDGSTAWEGMLGNLVPVGVPPVAVDAGGHPLEVMPAHEIRPQLEVAVRTLLDSTASLTGPAVVTPFVPPPVRAVSLGRAISEFFGYLVAAVAGAPARFLRAATNQVSERVARTATAAIYGDGADVQVVVNGRLPRRRGVATEDVAALGGAAAGMAQRLGAGLPVAPSVAAFAERFGFAATALLDGADQPDSGVTLPRRGTAPVVVGRADAVAPAPDAPGLQLPTGLGLDTDAELVTPWSPYSASRVRAALRDLEDQEVRSGGTNAGRLAEIQNARGRLDAWVGAQTGFTWQVQSVIADRVDQARGMLAGAIEELQRGDADDPVAADLARREARARKQVRWAAFAFPVVVVLAVLCVLLTPVLVAVLATVALVVVWSVVLVWQVVKAQSLAWKLVHRRDERSARRAWIVEQVRHLARELHRLTVAYGCAQGWARVVSGVVHRPFGALGGGTARPAPPPADQPLAMQATRGHFVPEAMAELVNLVRRSVLPAGWLGMQLRRRVDDIAVTRQREHGWDHPRSAYADPGVDDAGELAAAAARVGDPVVEERARVDFTRRVEHAVDSVERQRGGSWALESITVDEHTDPTGSTGTGPRTAASFLAPVASPRPVRLAEVGFVGGGTTDGAGFVDTPWLDTPTALVAGPGGGDLHLFDRSVVRLDRGRRCRPEVVGVSPVRRVGANGSRHDPRADAY